MYSPKYNISNGILKNIGNVEACREVIENAPIIPAYERRFREDAILRTVHHGTHVEGNYLSLDQAERVMRQNVTDAAEAVEKSGLTVRERDVQEVINYRAVVDWLDGQFSKQNKDNESRYTESQVKQIHKLTVHRLVSEENQGTYRKSQVVLRDSFTGEITFKPPPAVEVPYLMEDFISWINSEEGKEIHPVLRAGIAHYVLSAIHPFVEGNGRTARAFAILILFVEEYDVKRLFSLEEYFDKDAESYYKTLIETSSQSKHLEDRDLTGWLEYFTGGLTIELEKVKEKVRKLSLDTKVKLKRGQQVALSERQIKLVEYLAENEKGKMGEFKELFPDYSDDTILRDLQDLTEKDIIRKAGRTKGAFYELVT